MSMGIENGELRIDNSIENGKLTIGNSIENGKLRIENCRGNDPAEVFENALSSLLNENKAIWNELVGTVPEKTLSDVLEKVSSEFGVRSSESFVSHRDTEAQRGEGLGSEFGANSESSKILNSQFSILNSEKDSELRTPNSELDKSGRLPDAELAPHHNSIVNSQLSILNSPSPSVSEPLPAVLRPAMTAIVSAIHVSPTLATTGIGEIKISLTNEILDGSTVRFEVQKGGELGITIYPATQDAAKVLQTHLETFQTQLAERVTQWRVNVGVSAWNPKTSFKETERDA